MSNTILTPTAVTREAIRVLHQKSKFLRSINTNYDSSYANSGAKIGDTLKIRKPNRYASGTGAVATFADTVEESIDLKVSTQRWVAMNFTTAELTLSMDDFSKRIISPAMTQLGADIEADALSMYKSVFNLVDNDGAAASFLNVLQAKQLIDECLAPQDDQRTALLTPTHNTKLVDALKGLFNDSRALGAQYRDGTMGHSAGLDFDSTTFLSTHTTGTAAKVTVYVTDGVGQTGSKVTVKTGANSFKKGDVVTFVGCNAIHPETKADYGYLQKFSVTADYAGGAGDLPISPTIVVTGPRQNVSASPTDGGAVVKVGAGAGELLTNSLIYHKDAFAFATADLIMPKGVDFSARENFEGLSMRIVRNYDITNDKMPCRCDVMYGYGAIRPEWAARLHADA